MYCLHGCVTSLVHMLINLAEFVCFTSISVVYSCSVFCICYILRSLLCEIILWCELTW